MAEYIERRKVSNACYAVFEDVVRHPEKLTAEEVSQTLLRFEKAINSVSAAEVAPVVRCKDCKHWHPDDDEGHCDNPDGLDNYARADDFCSYGERKEGEG